MKLLTLILLGTFGLLTASFMGVVVTEIASLPAGIAAGFATLVAEFMAGRSLRRLLDAPASQQQLGGAA